MPNVQQDFQDSEDFTLSQRRKARIPSGYAQLPHAIARDPRLTRSARLLWAVLRGRQQSNKRGIRVKQSTLAEDLGVTERTVRRLVAELVSAGLLTVIQTGRSASYVVHNVSRASTQMPPQDASVGHECPTRQDIHVLAIEEEALSKKASTLSRPSAGRPQAAPAAASTTAAQELTDAIPEPDPIQRQAFLDALPAHLRPADSPHVADALAQALHNGWTVPAIAAAIAQQVTNPNARPGMAVTALRDLSRRPAREYDSPSSQTPIPGRYDPTAPRCEHGAELGCCPFCRRQRTSAPGAGLLAVMTA